MEIATELVLRFDYGSVVPWVRREDDARLAVAGPDALGSTRRSTCEGEDFTTVGRVRRSRQGERCRSLLTWFASHEDPPEPIDADAALEETEGFWREWSGRCSYTASGTSRCARRCAC